MVEMESQPPEPDVVSMYVPVSPTITPWTKTLSPQIETVSYVFVVVPDVVIVSEAESVHPFASVTVTV